jgi:hypothetical protein
MGFSRVLPSHHEDDGFPFFPLRGRQLFLSALVADLLAGTARYGCGSGGHTLIFCLSNDEIGHLVVPECVCDGALGPLEPVCLTYCLAFF